MTGLCMKHMTVTWASTQLFSKSLSMVGYFHPKSLQKNLAFAMKLVWAFFLVTSSGLMDCFHAEIGQTSIFYEACFRLFSTPASVLRLMLVTVGLCHLMSSAMELEAHLKISKCKLKFDKTVNSHFKIFETLAQKFCHDIPKNGYVFRAIVVLTQLAIKNRDYLWKVSYKM